MIRSTSSHQYSFPNFDLPFGGRLDPKNRWVRWGDLLPWEGLETAYHAAMDAKQGRPSKLARMVLGSLIVKHKLGLSDEETVRQIQENPYLQYFLGMHSFSLRSPFSPTLFVEFRKRLGAEVYGTRANRSWFNAHGIRYGGKPLGRPRKETEANRDEIKALKQQRKQDALDRIPVEGKFGQAKGGYGLNYIRAKLSSISEAWIRTIFLVMNLMVLITAFLRQILSANPPILLCIVRTMGSIGRLLQEWRGSHPNTGRGRYFISVNRHAC